MGTAERVRDLVQPVVQEGGVELYDVEHESGILRIMLDRDGGIDVDTIGDMSLRISELLDQHDPIPDSRYLLEVTSPGIERKLRTPEHFLKQVGEEINVKLRTPIDGARRFEAKLVSADKKGIEIAVGDSGESTQRVAYDDIESARLVFHWNDTSKPGSKNTTKSHATTTNKKVSAR